MQRPVLALQLRSCNTFFVRWFLVSQRVSILATAAQEGIYRVCVLDRFVPGHHCLPTFDLLQFKQRLSRPHLRYGWYWSTRIVTFTLLLTALKIHRRATEDTRLSGAELAWYLAGNMVKHLLVFSGGAQVEQTAVLGVHCLRLLEIVSLVQLQSSWWSRWWSRRRHHVRLPESCCSVTLEVKLSWKYLLYLWRRCLQFSTVNHPARLVRQQLFSKVEVALNLLHHSIIAAHAATWFRKVHDVSFSCVKARHFFAFLPECLADLVVEWLDALLSHELRWASL